MNIRRIMSYAVSRAVARLIVIVILAIVAAVTSNLAHANQGDLGSNTSRDETKRGRFD